MTNVVRPALRQMRRRPFRIGFGPLMPEFNGGGADFRHTFYPIIQGFRNRSGYEARYFTLTDSWEAFDCIVFFKQLNYLDTAAVTTHRQNGKLVFFELVDNPAGCPESYQNSPKKLASVTGVLAWSPVQADDLSKQGIPSFFIGPPIANATRRNNWTAREVPRLIWQGFPQNAKQTKQLLDPALAELSKEFKFTMIYHGGEGQDTDYVKHLPIKGPEWERMLTQADIGVVVKDLSDPIQKRKPYNKVVSYMAAGLTVVCTPTASDRLAVEDGVTGFFAHNTEDFYRVLRRLLSDRQEQIAIAKRGMESVWSRFAPNLVVDRYIELINQFREGANH